MEVDTEITLKQNFVSVFSFNAQQINPTLQVYNQNHTKELYSTGRGDDGCQTAMCSATLVFPLLLLAT